MNTFADIIRETYNLDEAIQRGKQEGIPEWYEILNPNESLYIV